MSKMVRARYMPESRQEAVRLASGGQLTGTQCRMLGYISPMAFEKKGLPEKESSSHDHTRPRETLNRGKFRPHVSRFYSTAIRRTWIMTG